MSPPSSKPSAELSGSHSTPPVALFRRPGGDGWWAFDRVYETVRADSLAAVPAVLAAAEQAASDDGWAVGFCCYEAAPAFEPAAATHEGGALPLAWFALCAPPRAVAVTELPSAPETSVRDLRATLTAAEHAAGVARIRRWISRGETYQLNYTHHLEARLDGDPWGLFLALDRGQRSPYAAWLDIGSHAVCSASPELFFELDGDHVVTRPMKGTAPRGRTTAEDRARSEGLAESAKNRAENVMIVDMIRNDLGRVARAGSVCTTRLCDIEKYDTVFQMTSTVEARTDAGMTALFAALFPCASITGAPKVRTMELIRELEGGPRGLYTGAIGYLAPRRRARFSVAIRTATVACPGGELRYGTGGGIVWDSDPAEEHAESEDKARILTEPRPDFELFETILWQPGAGFELLARHLDRLVDSARYFDFSITPARVRRKLEAAAAGWSDPRRVRVVLDRQGRATLESRPLDVLAQPVQLALAAGPVDSTDPFLFHKTTHRSVYDRARTERPDADDVLLWNERRELTESTIANVVLEIEGRRYTPPVESGLLAGTQRAELLARGEIEERILTLGDLESRAAIYLVNSVRGWMRSALTDSPDTLETVGGVDA